MDLTGGRRAAHAILTAVGRGELLDRAAEVELAPLEPRERAWTRELAYGVVRLRGRLDYLLDGLLERGAASLPAPVLDVLRLGAYQLRDMGGVPDYAAVSQSVELVRAVGFPRFAGLVNGVLQRLARGARVPAFPALEADPARHLATWGSHPGWLVERWVTRWGASEAAALVDANNRRPELYLRPVERGDPEGAVARALERLEAAGITAEAVPGFPDSIRITGGATPAEALAATPAVVQDPAAATVVRYAAPGGVRSAADLCAAPGGKTLGLAGGLAPLLAGAADEEAGRGGGGGAGLVVAADRSFERLLRVRENTARVGVGGIAEVVADARLPPLPPMSLVLVDAPCTGTGTFRRHPDGRWRVRPGDLESLGRLQGEMLDAAAGCVRDGGHLVYATCSLEPEENENRVEEFLRAHPDFAVDAGPVPEPDMRDDAGFLRILPQCWGVDGAFAARLRRGA